MIHDLILEDLKYMIGYIDALKMSINHDSRCNHIYLGLDDLKAIIVMMYQALVIVSENNEDEIEDDEE